MSHLSIESLEAGIPRLGGLSGRSRLANSADHGPRPAPVTIERGELDWQALFGDLSECLGVLILDGLLVAELKAGNAETAWLVGADDLIRPWEMEEVSLNQDTRWRVLERARVRPVDAGLCRGGPHERALTLKLLGAATRTSHWLFARSLVIGIPRVEDRILMLFALWGDRWGRATPDGVWINLRLTHELIARCCGARRPTVTVALGSLEKQGVMTRGSRDGWVLDPAPLGGERHSCWQAYSTVLGLDVYAAVAS